MTAVVVHMLLAATVFLEQDISGLRFTTIDPLTGAIQSNYRHIDLDQDGRTDLLFQDRVLFQREGLYPAGSSAHLPPYAASSLCDTGEHELYLRVPGGLRIVSWASDGWQTTLEQEIDWPDLSDSSSDDEPRSAPGTPMAFSRFLLDLEGDGVPEIVVYARDGVHIYRKIDDKYRRERVIDIYPQVTATTPSGAVVWPRRERRLTVPGQHRDLTAIWRDSQLMVVSRQDLRTGLVQYRSREFDPTSGNEVTIIEREYPLMPSSMRPLFLNGDGTLDFAGGAAVPPLATALAEPIFDTFVSTDEGENVRRFRSKSFAPKSNFVDMDGDGDIDLAVHHSRITSGGFRESLNRYFFQRKIGHQISFFLQNDAGEFVAAPGLGVDLSIQLDKVPYREGSVFRRYRAGDLVDLTGDFGGDGYKDLIVQVDEESLAIYISRGYRFSKRPIFYLSMDRHERFYVTDVDGNGMSDVVLIQPATDQGLYRSRVYFARQTAP